MTYFDLADQLQTAHNLHLLYKRVSAVVVIASVFACTDAGPPHYWECVAQEAKELRHSDFGELAVKVCRDRIRRFAVDLDATQTNLLQLEAKQSTNSRKGEFFSAIETQFLLRNESESVLFTEAVAKVKEKEVRLRLFLLPGEQAHIMRDDCPFFDNPKDVRLLSTRGVVYETQSPP